MTRIMRLGLVPFVILFVAAFAMGALSSLVIAWNALAQAAAPDPVEIGISVEQAMADRARITMLETDLGTAKADLEDLSARVSRLQAQVTEGYVKSSTVVVTEARVAYPLVEPKLMLGVQSLTGGSVDAYFGTETRRMAVGQRVDFQVRECDCFLVLQESLLGRATFAFGCERREEAEAPRTL